MDTPVATDWRPRLSFEGALDEGNGIEANVKFEADQPWFSGHFPSRPILPGIALLSVVLELLAGWGKQTGQRLTLIELKRIRFRRVVGPGEELLVTVRVRPSAGPGQFGFAVEAGGEKVCDGFLKADVTPDRDAG